MSLDPRIIVALDLAEGREALALADRLDPGACRLKVGLELFTASGPAIVTALRDRGFDVFLDLKYHDIPNTVARACARAAELGVWMVNVHALGGPRMLAAARKAVPPTTLLIGVTILTSHDSAELAVLGLGDAAARVQSLAHLCAAEGLDGVVCSPQEAALLRTRHARPFRLVTPGIRPSGSETQDQRRIATGREALAAGADYLVIGRPITAAARPHEALAACRADIGETG
ncbi:MAG: orotidine-5'-phosphate decarboxylase [Gammaproteobacteria bacterium]|nr:orotidine-5'-phosphate decarboxylase [Gammaproteobacteria bacterium]